MPPSFDLLLSVLGPAQKEYVVMNKTTLETVPAQLNMLNEAQNQYTELAKRYNQLVEALRETQAILDQRLPFNKIETPMFIDEAPTRPRIMKRRRVPNGFPKAELMKFFVQHHNQPKSKHELLKSVKLNQSTLHNLLTNPIHHEWIESLPDGRYRLRHSRIQTEKSGKRLATIG
jgi:hypothetical protein